MDFVWDGMTKIQPRKSDAGACLSAAQLARMAENAPELGEHAGHLAQCVACRAALQIETEKVRAARHARAPLLLPRRQPFRLRRLWPALAMTLGTIVVALVVTPTPQAAPSVAAQDELQAYATVLRKGGHVADNAPLNQVGPLRPEDRLLLRIESGAQRQVRVETHEVQGWQVRIETAVPADGWLPQALNISTAPHKQLRITACTDAQLPTSCSSHTYDF